MNQRYDVVVIGGGIVGASTAFHLRKFSDLNVALFERGNICTGGTAKSCAICRTHYTIPSNTQLTIESLAILKNIKDYLEDDEAHSGFVKSGYLILAPKGDTAEKLERNLKRQSSVGADTALIGHDEARLQHPWLNLENVATIGFEPESGYADPYLTTTSFVRAARRLGVSVHANTSILELVVDGNAVTGVRTEAGRVTAGTVVSAVGPWTQSLVASAGLDLPLAVSRHAVLTFSTEHPYDSTLPVVKDLTTPNKMYFRPATGGVALVGTGDHGDPVTDPDTMDENVASDLIALQGDQISQRMPGFSNARLRDSWIGPYDITPDWNPVLGPVEHLRDLHLAFGFSGHGFKLAPALGRMLAKTILGDKPEVSLAPYRLERFDTGDLLVGAYGDGSIS